MFTTQNTTCVSPSRPRRGLGSLLAAIPRALALRQQRNRLAALDARMLKDIGVTPRMAEEGMRVFDAYLGIYLPPHLPKHPSPTA